MPTWPGLRGCRMGRGLQGNTRGVHRPGGCPGAGAVGGFDRRRLWRAWPGPDAMDKKGGHVVCVLWPCGWTMGGVGKCPAMHALGSREWGRARGHIRGKKERWKGSPTSGMGLDLAGLVVVVEELRHDQGARAQGWGSGPDGLGRAGSCVRRRPGLTW
jgi:hypothetical protein